MRQTCLLKLFQRKLFSSSSLRETNQVNQPSMLGTEVILKLPVQHYYSVSIDGSALSCDFSTIVRNHKKFS